MHASAWREDVGNSVRRKKRVGEKNKCFEEDKLNIINGHRLRIRVQKEN